MTLNGRQQDRMLSNEDQKIKNDIERTKTGKNAIERRSID